MNEKELLQAIADLRDYWLGVAKNQDYDQKTLVNGVIFSILVMIDGDSSANDFNHISLIERGKTINKASVALHEMWCKY